jgi:hypothetical protein
MKHLTASILALSLVACVPTMSTPDPVTPTGPSVATGRVGNDPGYFAIGLVGILAVVGGVILYQSAMKDRKAF